MRQSLCFLFIINTSICSFTGTRELLGTTVFYVARTDTHTISLVVSHLYTFLKKKKKLSCDTEIFPITLTQQQQRKARCGGFQCRMGSLVGRPQRPSVYLLSGRAEDGDGVLSTVETKDSKCTGAKKLKKME